MKRTFTAIICTLLLVAVLAGCGSTNPFDAAAKTFSNEGMTITLTSDFSKQSMDDEYQQHVRYRDQMLKVRSYA